MLDRRVYRVAFLPALLALFVVAFSVGDPPQPLTTRVAPDAFNSDRALGDRGPSPLPTSLARLAADFPDRRPGGAGDTALSDRVAQELVRAEFVARADLRREVIEAETVDGPRSLRLVWAERKGLSPRRLVVVAHRDASGEPAPAALTATAVLLELGRVFADRDLRRTLVLASVSGGTGGFAGARELARRLSRGGDVDAVLVLGDLGSRDVRRPWVVPWSSGGPPAPHELRRTVEAALRAEVGRTPGAPRAIAQWMRRAVPITASEQGPVNAEGLPAVLVSASGERGTDPDGPVVRARFNAFGRGVLRALTALEEAGEPDEPLWDAQEGVVTVRRLLPEWAVHLGVLTLLLPALLAAVDAFFRVRRRRVPVGRWLAWVGAWALPFAVAWGWLRGLGATGAVDALPAPAAAGAGALDGAAWAAIGSTVLIWLVAVAVGRRLLVRRLALGTPATGGGAAAAGLLLAVLVLLVWIPNPYAAAVLVPAAHGWLLAAAPESRVRGGTAVAVLLAGLAGPLLVAAYFLVTLDAGAGGGLRLAYDLVAGGEVGVLDGIALSLFAGIACAVAAILMARRAAAEQAPPQRVTTRGPAGYAGPGSLGGTESALRR